MHHRRGRRCRDYSYRFQSDFPAHPSRCAQRRLSQSARAYRQCNPGWSPYREAPFPDLQATTKSGCIHRHTWRCRRGLSRRAKRVPLRDDACNQRLVRRKVGLIHFVGIESLLHAGFIAEICIQRFIYSHWSFVHIAA